MNFLQCIVLTSGVSMWIGLLMMAIGCHFTLPVWLLLWPLFVVGLMFIAYVVTEECD